MANLLLVEDHVRVLVHGRYVAAAIQAQPPNLILLNALLDDRTRHIGRVSRADSVLTQLTDASALVRADGALLARAPIEPT